jgi:hypothetical protein
MPKFSLQPIIAAKSEYVAYRQEMILKKEAQGPPKHQRFYISDTVEDPKEFPVSHTPLHCSNAGYNVTNLAIHQCQ